MERIENMKMNSIKFDTIVRREAYRNGFTNYLYIGRLHALISDTDHKNFLVVSYDEDDGFIIFYMFIRVKLIVGSEQGLGIKLRELSKIFMDLDDV